MHAAMESITYPAVGSAEQRGMAEPIHLPNVLFLRAEDEALCRQHLESKAVLTCAGIGPSGRPATCRGVIRSINSRSVLHPGYPLMVTIVETFPDGEH